MIYQTKRRKAQKARKQLHYTVLAIFTVTSMLVIFSQYLLTVDNITIGAHASPILTHSVDIQAQPAPASGVIREVTAYNSFEAQTDGSPCISADGKDICKRYQAGQSLCASNAFPLGSTINIQNFGNCTIVDRMNKRFTERVDIFMNKDYNRAVAFGKQNLLINLIK